MNINGYLNEGTELSHFLRSQMLPGESNTKFALRIGLPAETTRRLTNGNIPQSKNAHILVAYFGEAIRPILGLPEEGSETDTRKKNLAFREALETSLKREGLTLNAATVASGLGHGSILDWINGRAVPFRDSVERLAQVLREPSLINLIVSRRRQIKLICRECGSVRFEATGMVRAFEKRRDPTRFKVNWTSGEATQICGSCNSRALATASNQKIIRRKGRKALREIRARGLIEWRKNNPEAARKIHQVAAVAGAAATVAKRPLQQDEHAQARWRLSMLVLEHHGKISLCTVCQRVLFTSATVLTRKQAKGWPLRGKFHMNCYRTWLRTPEYREWMVACHAARRTGTLPPPVPVPPRQPNRYTVSEVWLHEAYETTLRYFWLREQVSRADRDEDGQVRSITWLAKNLGITRQTLYWRVKQFLDLLPDESTATGMVKIWRDVFPRLAERHLSDPQTPPSTDSTNI